MRNISNTNCSFCNNKLTNWDYRYKGEHYCRSCYDDMFPLRTCEKCFKKKKIHYALKVPICKICQVKDKPCIRCGAIEYKPGKITNQGPVCNICVKYFVELKICSSCNKQVINTSNRNLFDGTIKLLCNNCYIKTLPICSSCFYRRKPFTYTLQQLPLCKICSIEETRQCKYCQKSFPAGCGTICQECNETKTLNKKVIFISKSLNSEIADYFKQFSKWLTKRRGLNFTSIHIQQYHKYFLDIDSIYENLNRLPTYEEIVSNLTVVATRKNLLVTLFFDKKKLIIVDKTTKEKYANLDMINKYLSLFKNDKYKHNILTLYYEKLHIKLQDNKTTIRSIRLALTPAVKFLQYCDNFENNIPSTYILEGYLWIYSGQKSSIYGFVQFLSTDLKIDISIKNINISLQRPKQSKKLIKQKLIDLLRMDDQYIKQNINNLLKLAFGYLHGIEIKENVFLSNKNIKQINQDYYIECCKNQFYFPKSIINNIPTNIA